MSARCDHCPVAAHLECPNPGWHCRAATEPDRARQVAVLAASRAVRACPHRSDPACSCSAYATCALGKGQGGQVSHGECLTCQSEPPA